MRTAASDFKSQVWYMEVLKYTSIESFVMWEKIKAQKFFKSG